MTVEPTGDGAGRIYDQSGTIDCAISGGAVTGDCSELYPDDAARCPRDSTELKAVLDPLIGKTIGGRYRLISRLGSGGMSSVYLARHVMIDRLMAIKTLRRDLAQDPVQRDRFIREAQMAAMLEHPNAFTRTLAGCLAEHAAPVARRRKP